MKKNKTRPPQTPSAWGDGIDGEWEGLRPTPQTEPEPEQKLEPDTKSALEGIRKYWDPTTEDPYTKADPTRGEIA
jgi:hypothetical protein